MRADNTTWTGRCWLRVPRCLDLSRRELLVRKHPTEARMKRNFAPFSHQRSPGDTRLA